MTAKWLESPNGFEQNRDLTAPQAVSQQRRAEGTDQEGGARPETWNEKERTVEVVFGTDTPVAMPAWRNPTDEYKDWIEILGFDDENVRLRRMNCGALQCLENHNKQELGKVLAASVPETGSVDGHQGTVKLKFRQTENANEVFLSIGDRTLNAWSMLYRVFKYEITMEEGKPPVYRAVDWEVVSVDPVNISADYQTGARSLEGEKKMGRKGTQQTEISPPETESERAGQETGAQATPPPETGSDQQRSGEMDTDNPTTTPPPDQQPGQEIGGDFSEMIQLTRVTGRSLEWLESEYKKGRTVEEMRREAINALAKEQSRQFNPTVTYGTNEHKTQYEKNFVNALGVRAGFQGEWSDEALKLAQKPALEMCRGLLHLHGHNTEGTYGWELARDVLQTTGHFPILAGEFIRASLTRAYKGPMRNYERLISRVPAADYRAINLAITAEHHQVSELHENDEIKYTSTILEDGRTYVTKPYFGGIRLSHKLLVNDNLGAIRREIGNAGRAVIRNEKKLIVLPIVHNTAKFAAFGGKGTKPLFHADHKNLITGVDGITKDTFRAAEKALYLQTVPNKAKEPEALEYQASFLICSKDLEWAAIALVTPTTATRSEDVNPVVVRDHSTTVLVFSELDYNAPNTWFVAASPDQGPGTIEVSHLFGDQNAKITKREVDAKLDLNIAYMVSCGVGFVSYDWIVRNEPPAA